MSKEEFERCWSKYAKEASVSGAAEKCIARDAWMERSQPVCVWKPRDESENPDTCYWWASCMEDHFEEWYAPWMGTKFKHCPNCGGKVVTNED